MKKLTLVVLAMALSFGAFAQGLNRHEAKAGKFMPQAHFTSSEFKASLNQAKNATLTLTDPTVTANGGLFDVSMTVTMGTDATKYFVTCYSAGALEGYVDTNSTYHSMAQYLLAYADYYDSIYTAYGYSGYIYKTESGDVDYTGFYGNGSYEFYVLAVGADNSDTNVFTKVFTTPSSSMSGDAVVTVAKEEMVEDGSIEWTVNANDQTVEYYFMCEPADEENALYWIETYPDYFSTNEESAEYDLYYWLSGSYSDYFTYDAEGDVNEYFTTDLVSNSEYVEGTDYVYVAQGINGNGEEGEYVCVFFTFGAGSVGLNDVADFAQLSVYPNPSTDNVTVSSKRNIEKVELYNTLGQVVYANDVNATSVTVPVSNLTEGTYFVKVYSDGMAAAKKVVVR